MKLLVDTTDYYKTIQLAINLNGTYDKAIIFHCYWKGTLNEKHLYSIKSCYYFNIYNKNKHKIILWLENNISNNYNNEIAKYAEIKYLSFVDETKSIFKNYDDVFFNTDSTALYADLVRILLLYNYGGCWFDLDCFFLRSFDPIFYNYEKDICLYQWENKNYPNNSIYISLDKKSDKMKNNIDFIHKYNRGWGFQEAQLIYNLPLEFLVLPCSWFDGGWISNPYDITIQSEKFFKSTNTKYTFDNFFKGAFCYHWHNQWDYVIEKNSIIMQLINIIDDNIN